MAQTTPQYVIYATGRNENWFLSLFQTIHIMSTIKNQFDLHTRLFNNVLDGIEDSDSNSRANDQVNHVKWLAGHLTSTRFGFKDMAGLDADPYAEHFSHGNSIDPDADYPSIESIKANWNDISGKISAAMENLPAEAMAAPGPQVPISGGTMGDFLDFIMHHEAYHLGQMGLLRKFMGKDSMKYN